MSWWLFARGVFFDRAVIPKLVMTAILTCEVLSTKRVRFPETTRARGIALRALVVLVGGLYSALKFSALARWSAAVITGPRVSSPLYPQRVRSHFATEP